MNMITTLILIIMISVPGFAEDETLMKGRVSHGGFGGPVVKLTQIKNDFSVLVGGRGGWIINHSIVLGGGGYGLVNDNIDERIIPPDTTLFLTMGYGGFEFEYIITPHRLLHASFGTLIGGGGLDYSYRSPDRYYNNHRQWYDDAFFVFEPGANAEMNVTSFFRFVLGASYRLVAGVETSGLDDSDLSGPSANITLKFGKF